MLKVVRQVFDIPRAHSVVVRLLDSVKSRSNITTNTWHKLQTSITDSLPDLRFQRS